MADYGEKLRLSVASFIRAFETHGHISHPETILDPLELIVKETANMHERSGAFFYTSVVELRRINTNV